MRKQGLAWTIVSFILGLGFLNTVFANTTPDALARKAIKAEPETAKIAVSQLRAMGPGGLQVLLNINTAELKDSVEQQRWRVAIDAVAQQRDAAFSRLYWYTDLEQAKKVAQEKNKPILSLRMLGKLDEEMSCANSRYFRMALYANQQISQYLRENFILHWKSVRPVPKVSIDFGDGRKIERTVTGNSFHYLLDSQGNVIEVLPGLNAPQSFLEWLKRSEQLSISLNGKTEAERNQLLIDYHQARVADVQSRFQADILKTGNRWSWNQLYRLAMERTRNSNKPTAVEAGIKVPTKSLGEIRTVRSILPEQELPDEYTADTWDAIAAQHQATVKLDSNSISLIRSQNVTLQGDDSESRDTLQRVIRNFERSMAKDNVFNEYIYHQALHQWFIAGYVKDTNIENLTGRIYGELFYTPNSDPWLGLLPEDFYSGIENEGIKK